MTIKKYNILTGKLNNSIRVKLKDLTGSHFLFYKKGESIEELQKKCGKTKDEYTRDTPTNKEKLNTVAFFFKKEKLNWFKKIISSLVIKIFGKPYDWDSLREQMKNTGYDPDIKPIVIAPPTTNDRPYRLLDGNHRLRILRELYGNEYEIEVRYGRTSIIQKLLKSVLGLRIGGYEVANDKPKPCFWCSLENIKNYFKTFNMLTFIRTIKVLTAVIYVVVLNLKSLLLILLSLSLYSILVMILKRFDFDPTKIKVNIENVLLKKVIMSILSNVTALSLIIPLIIIMYNMIVEEPINFIIFGFLIWFYDKLEKKYEKKDD
jgi:hypothetical protein